LAKSGAKSGLVQPIQKKLPASYTGTQSDVNGAVAANSFSRAVKGVDKVPALHPCLKAEQSPAEIIK
jgi:hypothetical protein